MEIKKQTEVAGSGVPTAVQLEAINAQEPYKRVDQVVFEPELIVRKT